MDLPLFPHLRKAGLKANIGKCCLKWLLICLMRPSAACFLFSVGVTGSCRQIRAKGLLERFVPKTWEPLDFLVSLATHKMGPRFEICSVPR